MPNWDDANYRGGVAKPAKQRVERAPLRDSYCGKLIAHDAPASDKCRCSIWTVGLPAPIYK